MRCLACGAHMNLVEAVPETTMMVHGYERHTLQCSGCLEFERRLVFCNGAPARRLEQILLPCAKLPAVDAKAVIADDWQRNFAKFRARRAENRP